MREYLFSRHTGEIAYHCPVLTPEQRLAIYTYQPDISRDVAGYVFEPSARISGTSYPLAMSGFLQPETFTSLGKTAALLHALYAVHEAIEHEVRVVTKDSFAYQMEEGLHDEDTRRARDLDHMLWRQSGACYFRQTKGQNKDTILRNLEALREFYRVNYL